VAATLWDALFATTNTNHWTEIHEPERENLRIAFRKSLEAWGATVERRDLPMNPEPAVETHERLVTPWLPLSSAVEGATEWQPANLNLTDEDRAEMDRRLDAYDKSRKAATGKYGSAVEDGER
jgi:hypothetical protein